MRDHGVAGTVRFPAFDSISTGQGRLHRDGPMLVKRMLVEPPIIQICP